MKLEQVGSTTFTKALIMHGSWGHREIGTHPSTMTLFLDSEATDFPQRFYRVVSP